ncbi:MAG: hypothetical protein WCB51_01390 [Candidatus Dormiibacterota bacterium]
MSELRTPRRRRSVAVAPALLDPAELPEDAAGRVAIITVAAPDDITGAPAPVAPPASPTPHPSFLGASGGWVVAGFAGVVIVAVFIFGMLLTR